jgi:soluble lytic murein transglycosylase-like protein
MGEVSRHRHRARPTVVRATVLALVGCVLVSCGAEDPREAGPGPARTSSTSATSPAPGAPSAPSPSAPSATSGQRSGAAEQSEGLPRDPAAFARLLDDAVARVRSPGATPDEIRAAGELEQLAVRALARASASTQRTVLAGLSPAVGGGKCAELRAARLLTVITEPKRRFPPWRIIAPPPAPVLLGYYREAERRSGVPWNYLAAIHLVETRMGRIRGPSTAGALGPMQFLPSTWARYGAGGDINDPHDAIQAAARLLRAHGAPRNMAGALWHYNPSSRYVGAVTEYARVMERSPAAYRGYWHWRVFYHLRRGTFVLPIGFPEVRPVPVPGG